MRRRQSEVQRWAAELAAAVEASRAGGKIRGKPVVFNEHGQAEIVLREVTYAAGYTVRTSRVWMVGCPGITLRTAFTPNGEYIGDPRDARRLVVKRGIRPQLASATHSVCSIGYCAAEKKWYGWSHRAIYGFRVGSVVRKGDCAAESLPVGFRATNLAEAKQMAIAFARSVS